MKTIKKYEIYILALIVGMILGWAIVSAPQTVCETDPVVPCQAKYWEN